MEAITIDGLSIPEIGQKYLILNIEWEVVPNEHGRAKVSLRMLDDSEPENELKGIENKAISIKSKSAGVLFKGYIEDAKIIQQRNEHVLELALMTTSIKLDKTLRSYSFQKDSLTIEDVIKEVVSDDSGICEYIDSKVKSEKINKPIIRYKESGWEFVKRIASRYWLPVFVDETADKPTVKLGIKSSGSASSEDFLAKNVQTKINLAQCISRMAKEDGSKVKREEYKSIEIASYANFNVGMSASYGGVSGIILAKKAYLDEGELVFKYVIGQSNLYALTPSYNKKLLGHCLEGKVEKCEDETVKLQLDIDKEAKKVKSEGELYKFPWQPETGNLMYCMPEKDTVVSLYIGSIDEGDAVVINNLRKGKGRELDKPDNRYFTAADGKRLFYKKDEIGFSNDDKDEGSNNFSIRDEKGIFFDTDKDILLQADGKVEIKSNRKIIAQGKKKINLRNGSHSINLSKKFNIYAKSTSMGLGVALSECLEELKAVAFDGLDKDAAQAMYFATIGSKIFNRVDLSNHDKVEAMGQLMEKLSYDQRKDLNVLANADALEPDSEGTAWGKWAPIDWPTRMGLDVGQSEISRSNPVPVKLDRIGSPGGSNFGVMRDDGYIYDQNDRAIAYIKNDNAYHQYEFVNTHYFDYIDVISDDTQTTPDRLNEMLERNTPRGVKVEAITQKEFDDMKNGIARFQQTQVDEKMGTNSKYGLIGKAAEWNVEDTFIAKGGAGQLNTPIGGSMLIKLGVLKEVT